MGWTALLLTTPVQMNRRTGDKRPLKPTAVASHVQMPVASEAVGTAEVGDMRVWVFQDHRQKQKQGDKALW